MVQGAHGLRLPLEALQALVGCGRILGQDLDRDVAGEAGIAGTIDLAHASRPEGRDDLVGAETGARGQRHRGNRRQFTAVGLRPRRAGGLRWGARPACATLARPRCAACAYARRRRGRRLSRGRAGWYAIPTAVSIVSASSLLPRRKSSAAGASTGST